MDDQLQGVQTLSCKGERLEMDFEQAGCSSRVLPVKNLSASGQFKSLCSDVYGALKPCEWYNACNVMRCVSLLHKMTRCLIVAECKDRLIKRVIFGE